MRWRTRRSPPRRRCDDLPMPNPALNEKVFQRESGGELKDGWAAPDRPIPAAPDTVSPWTPADEVMTICGTTSATTSSAGVHGETVSDRKSTRLNSSHMSISYAVFCLKKKKSR